MGLPQTAETPAFLSPPVRSSLLAWPGTAVFRKPTWQGAGGEPQEPTAAPVTGSRHPGAQPHSCKAVSSASTPRELRGRGSLSLQVRLRAD